MPGPVPVEGEGDDEKPCGEDGADHRVYGCALEVGLGAFRGLAFSVSCGGEAGDVREFAEQTGKAKALV